MVGRTGTQSIDMDKELKLDVLQKMVDIANDLSNAAEQMKYAMDDLHKLSEMLKDL